MMRIFPFIILLLTSTGAMAQKGDLCNQLKLIVEDEIPSDFEGYEYIDTNIEEVKGTKEFRKVSRSFLDGDYFYFDPTGELNKKIYAYPYKGESKEEAAKKYLEIIDRFKQCDLVYKAFAGQPNPNVGLLATHTIGIDKRFYNSTISLFQYVSNSRSDFWIEYELVAPKLLED